MTRRAFVHPLGGRAWRAVVFAACLLVSVPAAQAQVLLRSYTAEERYNHVRLPAEGAALTVWTAPVTLRLEEVAVRFVNERDSVCAADVVVLASDGFWAPRQPRVDLHAPVRVWIAGRADTTVRVRMAAAPLVHAGEQFLAGAIVHGGALTVRMDRGLREGGSSLEVTRSMFALPRADGRSWRVGSSYADGRRIGHWYIDVLARESMRASQAQLVRDDESQRQREDMQRLDPQRMEAQREEAQRAADRRAAEVRDAEKRDAEKRDAEKRDAEKRDAEKRDAEKRDADARALAAQAAEVPEAGGTPRGPAEASAPVRTAPRVQPVPQSDDDELSSVLLVHVAESSPVVVRVENRRGARVRQLWAGTLEAGSHFFAWDGTGENGIAVTPGWYDLVVLVNGAEQARKSITRR